MFSRGFKRKIAVAEEEPLDEDHGNPAGSRGSSGSAGQEGPHLLVEQWTDHGAAVSVGFVHQRVQVGQEGVSDVQHRPGDLRERRIPGGGILPLKERRDLSLFRRDYFLGKGRGEALVSSTFPSPSLSPINSGNLVSGTAKVPQNGHSEEPLRRPGWSPATPSPSSEVEQQLCLSHCSLRRDEEPCSSNAGAGAGPLLTFSRFLGCCSTNPSTGLPLDTCFCLF